MVQIDGADITVDGNECKPETLHIVVILVTLEQLGGRKLRQLLRLQLLTVQKVNNYVYTLATNPRN